MLRGGEDILKRGAATTTRGPGGDARLSTPQSRELRASSKVSCGFLLLAIVMTLVPVLGCEEPEEPPVEPTPWPIDGARMFDIVSRFSSQSWGGRWPGDPGNERALAEVEQVFSDIGLEPAGTAGSFRQPLAIGSQRVLGATLTLDGSPFALDVDLEIPRYSGSATAIGELVFVGYGMTAPAFDAGDHPRCPLTEAGYDDYAGIDVHGKIALMLLGSLRRADPDRLIDAHCPANEAALTVPALYSLGYRIANARLHGALGVVLVTNYASNTDLSQQVEYPYSYYDPAFPVAVARRSRVEAFVPELPAWAAAIEDSLTPQSRALGTSAALVVEASVETDLEFANVIGARPGVDPVVGQEVIVVGAHIDTLEPEPYCVLGGAEDNASGVAVVLELARLVAGMERPPDRTVVFAAWNAEETGCTGSCSYVLSRPGRYPAMDSYALLNFDMVGTKDATGIWVVGLTEAPALPLGTLIPRAVEEDGLPYRVYVTEDPVSSNSDHHCFVAIGVPAVMLTNAGDHGHIHTCEDTAEWVPPQSLTLAARVGWATLRRLAYLDAEPDIPARSSTDSRNALSGCSVHSTHSSADHGFFGGVTGPFGGFTIVLLFFGFLRRRRRSVGRKCCDDATKRCRSSASDPDPPHPQEDPGLCFRIGGSMSWIPRKETALWAILVLMLWPGEARAPGPSPPRPTGADATSTPSGLSPAEALALRTSPTVRAVQRVAPAVVAIVSLVRPKENPYTDTPWGSYYKPKQSRGGFGIGSGVIVDRQGHVLTNEHVISQATDIFVRLSTGVVRAARLVGASPSLDLALLEIKDRADYPFAVLADSSALLHGEVAIAIGTPLGLTQSVSQGVVSATRRSMVEQRRSYVDYIQTDASIHPGNSGGPLLNILGEVIGINTARLSDGPGIGLAIPSNVARRVMSDLMKNGRVRFPYLGLLVTDLKGGGVQVTRVDPGSPAAQAGLLKDDKIHAVHDLAVRNSYDYWSIVRALVPGTRVNLRLARGTVSVLVSGSAEAPPSNASPHFQTRLGLTLGEAAEHADRLHLIYRRGAVILHVVQGGSAWSRNLRPGDVIVGLAAQQVRRLDDLNRIAKTLRPNSRIHLIVARGKSIHSFTMDF